MSLEFVIKKRPLRFLSFLGGLRDTVLGLAFLLNSEEIRGTVLYFNFDSLIPGLSGPVAGWVFLIVGLVAIVTSMTSSTLCTNFAKYAQWISAAAWMFAGVMYALGGFYLHAVIFGMLFGIPAAYTAYHYHYYLWWKKKEAEMQEEIDELKRIIRGQSEERPGE